MDSRTCVYLVRECEGQSVQTHENVYIGFVSVSCRVCRIYVSNKVCTLTNPRSSFLSANDQNAVPPLCVCANGLVSE